MLTKALKKVPRERCKKQYLKVILKKKKKKEPLLFSHTPTGLLGAFVPVAIRSTSRNTNRLAQLLCGAYSCA